MDRKYCPDTVDKFSDTFLDAWDVMQAMCHNNAVEKGWWESNRSDGECIALMHSELSEALEYLRKGNGASDHITGFSGGEEELADVVIRIMDFAERKGMAVSAAILEKMKFNATRPYKHGKKF